MIQNLTTSKLLPQIRQVLELFHINIYKTIKYKELEISFNFLELTTLQAEGHWFESISSHEKPRIHNGNEVFL
jgi:hypothetical protein